MSKKIISPIYCVLLFNTFPNYLILHKTFEDKDMAFDFGQDLWGHIQPSELKNITVFVTIIEDPKDYDYTYGDIIKGFYVSRDEDVKAYQITYWHDMRKLNGFINAYSEEDARFIYSKRTHLNPESIIDIKELE